MRESISSPRELQNRLAFAKNSKLVNNETITNMMTTITGISNTFDHSTLSIRNTCRNNLTTNINRVENRKLQQFNNNNQPICNSNLTTKNQSSKQIKNFITSPNYQILRNDSYSLLPNQKNLFFPIISGDGLKYNNCIENDHYEKLVLLQTPISSSTNKNIQNNNKNKQENSDSENNCTNQYSTQYNSKFSLNRSNYRYEYKHQNSSSQQDSSSKLYTDSTGIDLQQFITDTINRNQKDRTVLLKIEKDLIEFVKDKQKVFYKFPNMSSYNRMLVHRVAAYFGMEHNVDQSGLSVIVTRTKNIRIPDTRFKKHIRDDLLLTEEPRRSILKRDSNSFEDTFNFKSSDRLSSNYCRRSKSFEEREEEYEKARRRIFKDSNGENNKITSWTYWSSTENSETSSRYRLLHPSDHSIGQQKILKQNSFDNNKSVHSNYLQPSVSKSFNFGDYTKGMFSRIDNIMPSHSASGHLMKQDSGMSIYSHLNPLSNGYKSQSHKSDATTCRCPLSSMIPNIICKQSQNSNKNLVSHELKSQKIMWAIKNVTNIPSESAIMNSQINQSYINQNGSLYRFDPNNPPKYFIEENQTLGVNVSSYQIETFEHYKIIIGNKKDNVKRRSKVVKYNSNCNSTSTTSTITTSMIVLIANKTCVTNSIMSSKVSFTSPLTVSLSPLPWILHQHQQLHQSIIYQPQLFVRTITIQPYNHDQTIHTYANYIPTSAISNQSIYQYNLTQQVVTIASHFTNIPLIILNNEKDVFNQNPVFANYSLQAQYSSILQCEDVTDLSNYFVELNTYDQRRLVDSQISSYCTFGINRILTTIQPINLNYWQTSANQAMQQTMYLISPPETTVTFNQNQS